MKKFLLALMALLLAVGMVGVGTLAYYQDTETSTGNMFKSGTFDIDITQGHTLPFQFANKEPGFNDYEEHYVVNTGSVAGKLWITSEDFQEPSGGFSEPAEPENSIEVGPADFADVLQIKVYANIDGSAGDSDSNQGYEADELIYEGSLRDLDSSANSVSFAAGQGIWFKFEVNLPTDLNDADDTYDEAGTGSYPAIPYESGTNEDDNAYQADGVQCSIKWNGSTAP